MRITEKNAGEEIVGRRYKIAFLIALAVFGFQYPCLAQKKKQQVEKPKVVEAPKAKPEEKKKDTLTIIYEKAPAKRRPGSELIDEPAKKAPVNLSKDMVIEYDTVHVKRRRRQGEEIIEEDKPRNITVYQSSTTPAGTKPTVAAEEELKSEGTCKCVKMELKAQDTIGYNDYVNYQFIFTNTCKQMVYIHSGSFRYSVADYFGHPIKRIRTVDFVKRFDYPEYVRVSPGETFEFRFADDPFFEFDMHKGMQYKFNFMYNSNAINRSSDGKKGRTSASPAGLHTCMEAREHMVSVK
ncbi:MAG: hypothetical protein JST82_00785 [Bacteroidetes bacterium]|nr:hypothetical protein [Bacteroidota bacterium]